MVPLRIGLESDKCKARLLSKWDHAVVQSDNDQQKLNLFYYGRLCAITVSSYREEESVRIFTKSPVRGVDNDWDSNFCWFAYDWCVLLWSVSHKVTYHDSCIVWSIFFFQSGIAVSFSSVYGVSWLVFMRRCEKTKKNLRPVPTLSFTVGEGIWSSFSIWPCSAQFMQLGRLAVALLLSLSNHIDLIGFFFMPYTVVSFFSLKKVCWLGLCRLLCTFWTARRKKQKCRTSVQMLKLMQITYKKCKLENKKICCVEILKS